MAVHSVKARWRPLTTARARDSLVTSQRRFSSDIDHQEAYVVRRMSFMRPWRARNHPVRSGAVEREWRLGCSFPLA